MKVQSLVSNGDDLTPVEVELKLAPGLPTITFLGLPDQHLKESALRIKSAIRNQGFEFPKAQQIIVNLRPSYLKKNSRGIELAVAAAFLWESEQIVRPVADVVGSEIFVYGELSLNGDVYVPEGLSTSFSDWDATVLTGVGLKSEKFNFSRLEIGKLSELNAPRGVPVENGCYQWLRPTIEFDGLLSKSQAEFLKIICTGEHSALLAGPSGSGKTTLAKLIPSLVAPPWPKHALQIKKNFPHANWRPFIKPHHTTPPISMVGGGSGLQMGEIVRAHGGVLLLDEMLEFHPQVHEALREPFEEGCLRIVRGGRVKEFKAESLIIGTTNLCPCGDFVPGRRILNCRYGKTKCHSYSHRLSGPVADRFQIIYFSSQSDDRLIKVQTLLEQISAARKFAEQTRGLGKPNGQLGYAELKSFLNQEPWFEKSLPRGLSERRKLSQLRVARTIADLESSLAIEAHHLNKAQEFAVWPFEKIRQWE
jgi:magnesium chelatase family protein